MAKYSNLNTLFTAIANSIRGKTGGSGKIVADDFPDMIDSISSGGITPTGTKNITANGTHDVTNFASANVNVPAPEQSTVIRTITIDSDITNTPWNGATIISADEFIKAHYADTGFSATLIPHTQPALTDKAVHFIHHGNTNIGASDSARYAAALMSSGSTVGSAMHTSKINGEGYNVALRVDSSGNLKVYVQTAYTLKAGTYLIILTCTT